MVAIYFIIIFALVVSLVLTPLVIKFAFKYKFIDIPKDERRVHSKPMPRVGGIAIVFSIALSLLMYYLFTKNIESIALDKKILGYVIGATSIALMGFIDDAFTLRARYKFIFQLVAAIAVCAFGIIIDTAKVPFVQGAFVNLGIFSIPITMVWVITITNAVNLIDGLDGLAAGISAISASALLIIFVSTSVSLEAIIITAALLGSTLGFLPYNFNPAKTFMGDVGSNFLGFTLSVVSILGLAKGYTLIVIVVPILVLGVPIFDTLFAMVRRFFAGKPLLTPDGGHVHHRLLKHGFNQRQAVLILYTITSILCTLAVTIISKDINKLILLIIATISFIILGIITTKKKHEEENINTKNEK